MSPSLFVGTVDVGDHRFTVTMRSISKGDRYAATCDDFRKLLAYGETAKQAKERLEKLIREELQRDAVRHGEA